MDLSTGITLIGLLLLMLQMEHNRCDRIRDHWANIRSAIYRVCTGTQAVLRHQNTHGLEALETVKSKETLMWLQTDLYSCMLTHGSGKIKRQLKTLLDLSMLNNAWGASLLNNLAPIDNKIEKLCELRKLRFM